MKSKSQEIRHRREEEKSKMDAEFRAFLLKECLCPKNAPLIRASFCPKIKNSCFSMNGNCCEFSTFSLVSIESLSDRVRTQWEAYQRKIIEKSCPSSLKNGSRLTINGSELTTSEKAGMGDHKDVVDVPMSASPNIS